MKENTICRKILKSSLIFLFMSAFLLQSCSTLNQTKTGQDGWISLFDGKSLKGWTASENPGTFRIEDGVILAQGLRSHLYYTGPVMNHNFKNFEFKVDVKTEPGANSGVYFHSNFLKDKWPDDGFEVQINNSGGDWKRTGSLYDVLDFGDVYVKDNEWFTMYIKVVGKEVVVKLNDKTVLGWTQPDDFVIPEGHPGRIISSGTFAFQEHDPNSVIRYRNIKVRPLQ